MGRLRRCLVTAALVLAPVAAGCGGGEASPSNRPSPPSGAPEAPSAAQPGPAEQGRSGDGGRGAGAETGRGGASEAGSGAPDRGASERDGGGGDSSGSGGGSGSVDPARPDREGNDVPPPAGSPAERFERFCEKNPRECL